MDMKGEELSMPLPEELVERILAMVPFPQIFKARALSKSWRTRLSSISSHDDEEKKLLAVSFQKRVCEWSYRWNTSSPVFLFANFLIAHDHASQRWRKIPTLSAIPDREAMTVARLLRQRPRVAISSIVGALLLVSSSHRHIAFVINILTGSWKELPMFPQMDWRPSTAGRLVSSKDMYKVIRLYTDVGCVGAWIYDSKLCAWRSKTLEVLQDFVVGEFDVYLNGFLYVMVLVRGPDELLVWGFLTFDVKEETFNLIQMPRSEILGFLPLLACNGSLYVAVPQGSRTVVLLVVDVVNRRWSQVTRGPPASLKFGDFLHVASSDGDCLLFQGTLPSNGILAYNVRKDEWSSFAMNPILSKCVRSYQPYNFDAIFQPGMNPFLEV